MSRAKLFLLALLPAVALSAEFEAASIKINKTADPAKSNIPLGPGAVNAATGGLFSATGYPLVAYIAFAYDLASDEIRLLIPQLPRWALDDRYDVQARAAGNPTKSQMRPMMQSLLAERCKLAIHKETREVPVLELVLVKTDRTGLLLQAHPPDSACLTEPPPPLALAGGFPAICGEIGGMPPSAAGRQRVSARNVTMATFAKYLAGPQRLEAPVLDKTGLTGTFDLMFEYTPDFHGPPPPGVAPPDPDGPTVQAALREQLGLTLERGKKGAVDFLVVDHVERPSGN
ncbi:conserved exported hypothetical protein [Candidatus Sulfopaludibacter sp. SbA3]|nr:conserved exported hypothetical protein [Candidatus Sulfopaludibacter sp. SbA3]